MNKPNETHPINKSFIDLLKLTNKNPPKNVIAYLISNEWLTNLDFFVEFFNDDKHCILGGPGSINNSNLLKSNSSVADYPSLQSNLLLNEDFQIISHSYWKILQSRFGGGPELAFINSEPLQITNDFFQIVFEWTSSENKGINFFFASKTARLAEVQQTLFDHLKISADQIISIQFENNNFEFQKMEDKTLDKISESNNQIVLKAQLLNFTTSINQMHQEDLNNEKENGPILLNLNNNDQTSNSEKSICFNNEIEAQNFETNIELKTQSTDASRSFNEISPTDFFENEFNNNTEIKTKSEEELLYLHTLACEAMKSKKIKIPQLSLPFIKTNLKYMQHNCIHKKIHSNNNFI